MPHVALVFCPECWSEFQFLEIQPPRPHICWDALGGISIVSWLGRRGSSLGTAGAVSNAPRFPRFYPKCWTNFQFSEIRPRRLIISWADSGGPPLFHLGGIRVGEPESGAGLWSSPTFSLGLPRMPGGIFRVGNSSLGNTPFNGQIPEASLLVPASSSWSRLWFLSSCGRVARPACGPHPAGRGIAFPPAASIVASLRVTLSAVRFSLHHALGQRDSVMTPRLLHPPGRPARGAHGHRVLHPLG